jgi:hypothetical protein
MAASIIAFTRRDIIGGIMLSRGGSSFQEWVFRYSALPLRFLEPSNRYQRHMRMVHRLELRTYDLC